MITLQRHTLSTGFFRGRNILVDGGVMVPGALVTWVPRVDGMGLRHGMVVSVIGDEVHVAWNPWTRAPHIKRNELMHRYFGGALDSEQRRQLRKVQQLAKENSSGTVPSGPPSPAP